MTNGNVNTDYKANTTSDKPAVGLGGNSSKKEEVITQPIPKMAGQVPEKSDPQKPIQPVGQVSQPTTRVGAYNGKVEESKSPSPSGQNQESKSGSSVGRSGESGSQSCKTDGAQNSKNC